MKFLKIASCSMSLGFLLAAFLIAQGDRGILVMAHGGGDQWNATVRQTVEQAHLAYPVRVFFGMGCTKKETQDLDHQVQDLEKQGVHSIVVIPLIISSYSEVYRQWRYLLGLEAKPGFDPKEMASMPAMPGMPEMNMFEEVTPVPHKATIIFPHGLDDDVIVSSILLKRAQEISRHPSQESVIIVAHGPNQDADNRIWLANIQHLAATVQEQGHFASVEGATLRDDAPPPVRAQAVEQLRHRVVQLGKGGRHVLVIPLLLAPGGIEDKIRRDLAGTSYTFNAHMLLPDPRLSDWIHLHSQE